MLTAADAATVQRVCVGVLPGCRQQTPRVVAFVCAALLTQLTVPEWPSVWGGGGVMRMHLLEQ